MKLAIIAFLSFITISCASISHTPCDAYGKTEKMPNTFDEAELWFDHMHNKNNVNNL